MDRLYIFQVSSSRTHRPFFHHTWGLVTYLRWGCYISNQDDRSEWLDMCCTPSISTHECNPFFRMLKHWATSCCAFNLNVSKIPSGPHPSRVTPSAGVTCVAASNRMFNNMIQQKAKIFSSTTKGLQNACKKKKCTLYTDFKKRTKRQKIRKRKNI